MDDEAEVNATHLERIAAQLAARIREDDPISVHRWLRHAVADADVSLSRADRLIGLACLLAAAVPQERSWKDLTSWARDPRSHPQRYPQARPQVVRGRFPFAA